MLTLTVTLTENFNDETQEFEDGETVTIELEHSLVSMSKWEAFFEKPFLGQDEKTHEETLWYLKAMILTTNLPEGILQKLSSAHLDAINNYVHKKSTATWFTDEGTSHSREVITAEIIYYWMVALQIPFECQYWHLNRLMTLIKVINQKNAPAKKQSARDAAQRRRELNEQRRARLGTKG